MRVRIEVCSRQTPAGESGLGYRRVGVVGYAPSRPTAGAVISAEFGLDGDTLWGLSIY